MDPSIILVVTVMIIITVAMASFFVNKIKKAEKEVVEDLREAEAKGESIFIPEEYNNVSLGVGSGIKFGFGFGIGIFFAGLIITFVLYAFFGFTMYTMFSNMIR